MKRRGGVGGQRRWQSAVATVVAVALVAGACGDSGGDADNDAATAGEVTTKGITGTVEIRGLDIAHPAAGDDVEPIGDVVEITTDGTVEAGATVTVEAGDPIRDDELVVAVTAETEDGPWEPLPVTVSGTQVTASIEHLSLFSFLRFPDPTGIVEELFNDVTSDLFAAATPPTCDDEDGARGGGYEIKSDGPDVLMWCLGHDGQGRYLRVVNNRRYPVILSSSLPLREGAEASTLGDRLSDALAGDRVALPPRSQITYAANLEPGSSAQVNAKHDGLAYSLYQLQFGVELAAAFLTRFGTQVAAPRSLDALLTNAGCVDALVAAAPGRILTSCLDYDGLSALFGSLGAAIAAPIIVTAGVLSYFQTAAETFWDETITGRDNYTIAVARTSPAPTILATDLQGDVFGYVTNYDAQQRVLTIDVATLIEGDAWLEYVFAHPDYWGQLYCENDSYYDGSQPRETCHPTANDYLIENVNPRLRELTVSPSASVELIPLDSSTGATAPAALDQLANHVHASRMGNTYRIRVSDTGEVTSIYQQFFS